MADDSLFLIDIDKILREKAPKQSKYIPKFVVSYLKHTVLSYLHNLIAFENLMLLF